MNIIKQSNHLLHIKRRIIREEEKILACKQAVISLLHKIISVNSTITQLCNGAILHFIFYSLFLNLVFVSCSPRYSVISHRASPYFQQIDEILDDSLLTKGETGIRVISAKTGEVFYERNSEKFFPPASNMKLITTTGALALLKPEFRFKTFILTDGKIEGDTLKGDMLLKGNGDPTINTETLSQIVKELKLKGIGFIDGALLFDDSFFDTIPYGKGWMWDDLEYGFSSPISALSVNRNTCSIFVRPGKKKGDSLIVNIEPEAGFVSIKNEAITGDKDNLVVIRLFQNGKNFIVVKGTLCIEAKTKIFIRSIEKPALYTSSIFAEKLKENGIKIERKVERDCSGRFQDTLLIHYSEPLIKILYDMNKESSNFIAESVLKTIGAKLMGTPGTARKGIKAIEKFMQDKRIIRGKFLQKDGSGLSRYNLISPHQITSLLLYLYHRFEYAPEILTVLPIGGIDGTLQKRMKDENIKRRVRAKTGTMSGISTLSGYCITNSGKVLIFSMMMKDYIASPSYVRKLQDSIVKILIAF